MSSLNVGSEATPLKDPSPSTSSTPMPDSSKPWKETGLITEYRKIGLVCSKELGTDWPLELWLREDSGLRLIVSPNFLAVYGKAPYHEETAAYPSWCYYQDGRLSVGHIFMNPLNLQRFYKKIGDVDVVEDPEEGTFVYFLGPNPESHCYDLEELYLAGILEVE